MKACFVLILNLTFLYSCKEIQGLQEDKVLTTSSADEVDGYNIESLMSSCNHRITCPHIFTRLDGVIFEYGNVCEDSGHETIRCGCSQTFCSKNLNSSLQSGYRPEGLDRGPDFNTDNSCLVYEDSDSICAHKDGTLGPQPSSEEQHFINTCEESGKKAVRCGCSDQYLCVEK